MKKQLQVILILMTLVRKAKMMMMIRRMRRDPRMKRRQAKMILPVPLGKKEMMMLEQTMG